MRISFLAIPFACVITPCNATARQPDEQRQTCSIAAYVTETDPRGLNVRAAPSAGSRVLGKIAPRYVEAADPTLVALPEVRVTAGERGWFLVEGAHDNPALMGGEHRVRAMYSGRGWVSGSRLTVKSQAEAARLAPEKNAGVAFVGGTAFGFDSLGDKAPSLVACRGIWAQVQYSLSGLDAEALRSIRLNPKARVGAPPGHVRGWLNRLCDVQETSCDGLSDE